MPVYLIVGVALIAHGIGHVLGLMPILGWAAEAGWTSESWLLTGPLGASVANLVATVLWLVPLVGFTLVGLGVLGIAVPAAWVRPLAVVAKACARSRPATIRCRSSAPRAAKPPRRLVMAPFTWNGS